jgi:hypothetical protein
MDRARVARRRVLSCTRAGHRPCRQRAPALVGSARPRHSSFDRLDLLRRYVAELFLGGGDRRWSRLPIHGGQHALFRGRPGRGFRFELGVDARLHGVDLTRTRTGMCGISRCSKCHCSENQNAWRDHDNPHDYGGGRDGQHARHVCCSAIALRGLSEFPQSVSSRPRG